MTTHITDEARRLFQLEVIAAIQTSIAANDEMTLKQLVDAHKALANAIERVQDLIVEHGRSMRANQQAAQATTEAQRIAQCGRRAGFYDAKGGVV